jgi:exo-beta-1,3-glucanase (GH17 family)
MTENMQEYVDGVAAAIRAKGYTNAVATIEYRSFDSISGHIAYYDAAGERQWQYFYANGSAHDAYVLMRGHVAKLPTAYDAKQQAFRLQVVKILELGRELGVDVDFINPLEAMVKKLTENVIEDKSEEV